MSAINELPGQAIGDDIGPRSRHVLRPDRLFQIFGEIGNFDALRRRAGCASADRLVDDIVERLAARQIGVQIARIGRRQIEINFEGYAADELRQAIANFTRLCAVPLDLDGELHVVEMIFGGASTKLEHADTVLLAEEAERALAAARAANCVLVPELESSAAADAIPLKRELAEALERDELLLHYQPKLNVRLQKVTSAEGLIRWNHPQRGIILPGDFILAAERAGLIAELTLWTIRRVVADQVSLAERGQDIRLFINVSGQLLTDSSFVRSACDLLAATDAKLGFEVTETSVIRDPKSAMANLQLFADFGVVLAIDDYGVGLSSLAYLKQLPARELKIDRLFISQLTSSHRDPLIVRSTIDLAHALDMEVVAEGVETHAVMALLTVMGCDMIQGFLISRPVGIDALYAYLEGGLVDTTVKSTFRGGLAVKLAG